MGFVWVWLLILGLNLISGLLLSRIRFLRQFVDRISFPRPSDTERPQKATWPRTHHPSRWIAYVQSRAKTFYHTLLVSDDEDYSGFAPPRLTRSLISSIIIIQNLIAVIHSAKGGAPVADISMRTGQLTIANMLPLVLSVAPDTILVHLLQHSRQQVLWLHTFYGWLTWYQAVLHVSISLFATSQLASWTDFALMFMGFLACLGFCSVVVSTVSPKPKLTSTPRQHCVVGLVSLALGLLHSIRINLITSLGLAIFTLGLWAALSRRRSGSLQQISPQHCLEKRRSKVEIPGMKNVFGWLKFGVEVPNYRGSLYFMINGRPVRAAWTERSRNSQHACKAIFVVPPDDMQTLECEGPFVTPLTPYVYGPDQLDIIVTDSGIIEGYSCLRWRCRILNDSKSSTKLLWFCKDIEFLAILITHLKAGANSDSIKIVFYMDPASSGMKQTDPAFREAIREAEGILESLLGTQSELVVVTEYEPLRSVLKKHMRYSQHQYIVGESLRSYREKPVEVDSEAPSV